MTTWKAARSIGVSIYFARIQEIATSSMATITPAMEVATTKAFAKPFASRRCLIPATGWYEFAPAPVTAPAKTRKQPYFMTPYEGAPVVFAGLWSVWGEPDERPGTVDETLDAVERELEAQHRPGAK